jgi:hypothetical protein
MTVMPLLWMTRDDEINCLTGRMRLSNSRILRRGAAEDRAALSIVQAAVLVFRRTMELCYAPDAFFLWCCPPITRIHAAPTPSPS